MLQNFNENIKLIKKTRNNLLYDANTAFYIQMLFVIYGLTGNTLYYPSQLLAYFFAVNTMIYVIDNIKRNEVNEKNKNNYIS